jgi:hypothetical protein
MLVARPVQVATAVQGDQTLFVTVLLVMEPVAP